MVVTKMNSTCSMIEVGQFNRYDLDSIWSFRNRIDDQLRVLDKTYLEYKNYGVIYNSTCKKTTRRLKSFGFRKIGSYKGEYSYKRVQILLWEPSVESLWQRIINRLFH